MKDLKRGGEEVVLTRREEGNVYIAAFDRKCEGTRPLGRPGYVWKVIIEIDFKKWGWLA